MRLLLDTQAFVLLIQNTQSLPPAARSAVGDPNNQIYLSVASAWELQIKVNINKIAFAKTVREMVEFEVHRGAIQLLPITLAQIDELSRLPMTHRDPFDRVLVAQARVEQLTIVSGDHRLRQYPVPIVWD